MILPVKLANIPLEMILNLRAGPSVIELATVRELGLEQRTHRRSGTIYGVGENPVHLLGNITIDVDVGDNQLVQHSYGMLQGTSQVRVLGSRALSAPYFWERAPAPHS